MIAKTVLYIKLKEMLNFYILKNFQYPLYSKLMVIYIIYIE